MSKNLRSSVNSAFSLRGSTEGSRPFIDFEARLNQKNDWGLLDDIVRGEQSLKAYKTVRVVVSDPEAVQWDFFSVPGTSGLFSERAIGSIPEAALADFARLPAQLNHRPYYFLKCTRPLRCLDTLRSKLTYFSFDPQAIKSVEKFAFIPNTVFDPLVFCPEGYEVLLVTSSIAQTLTRDCKGFKLIPLECAN